MKAVAYHEAHKRLWPEGRPVDAALARVLKLPADELTAAAR